MASGQRFRHAWRQGTRAANETRHTERAIASSAYERKASLLLAGASHSAGCGTVMISRVQQERDDDDEIEHR